MTHVAAVLNNQAPQARLERNASNAARDALIVSSIQVDGVTQVLSYYGDDIWYLSGFTRIEIAHNKKLDFRRVPAALRASLKAVIFRYLMHGREGQRAPKGPGTRRLFRSLLPFLSFLEKLGITDFRSITPLICVNYASQRRNHKARNGGGKLLAKESLKLHFVAIEALWELSQYTADPMPRHPWPDTTSHALSGVYASRQLGGKTPLIPDEVFCTIFQEAYSQVQKGTELLEVRQLLQQAESAAGGVSKQALQDAKARCLKSAGFAGGLALFNKRLVDLRTACYVVIASTSGIRVHEGANLENGSHFTTEDDEGETYHWMRARSDKTDAGVHDWMIPEAAVLAIQVMERWAEPYQEALQAEIRARRLADPEDAEIAVALDHSRALFLGKTISQNGKIRVLSTQSWNKELKDFAVACGVNWSLSTHQFRRKFANYAAHSKFGDLRYLREHYAHWSMDMTLGYAMDRDWGLNFDTELYEDIQAELEDIKINVAGEWLREDEQLAGGYGKSLERWKRDPRNLALFPDRKSMVSAIATSTAIRSNGHAWCTADDDGCVGNTLEKTRCSGCDNAVIGRIHAGIYKRLYSDLKQLLEIPDIGGGGRQRVLRDIERCRSVLHDLGYHVEPVEIAEVAV